MGSRTILEYLDAQGRSPFARWFGTLDSTAARRVRVALYRVAEGNDSALAPIGQGLTELRIDHGPGLRVYLAVHGSELIVLLGGGSKARQQKDIDAAKDAWRDYRARKAGGG